jgi:tetratricopeptide (TPR) repeat protein/tRNA A-37 threonylcarbamoyl transferase component Bud32
MASCAHCGVEVPAAFRFCPSCGTQRVGDASGDPLIGRTLGGKYRVLEKIGEGSMGSVYRSEHIALKKAIAIKILRRDVVVGENELRRFQREGIAAGQLSHRNVTQVFDFDRADDGLVFLAMELVEGQSLAAWLKERGALPPAQAVDFGRQLLATLAEAHRHGIIHRDLKPENIMVVEAPDAAPAIKVLDFGLSKLVDRSLESSSRTLPGRVVGTPLYMAPEQWRGEEVDSRADLYSAALILYEMLAGERPFRARDLSEVMVQATSQPPPSLHESKASIAVPDALDAVVRRGLAKARDERFQTAGEMLRALDAVELGSAPRRRPLPWRRIAAALLAVAAVASGAWGLVQWLRSDRHAAPALLSTRAAVDLSADERRYVDALRSARRLIHESDYDAARGAVERAFAQPCVDAEGFVVRGLLARARHETELASNDFQKALDRLPGDLAAEAGLGWVACDLGQFDKAGELFGAVLKRDPQSPEGLAGCGAVALARGDAAKATEELDRAASLHPDDALVQYWRGRAKLKTGDFAGALQAFGRAAQADEVAAWEACEGLGDAYVGLGNADGAKRQYGDALRFLPTAGGVRRKLAAVLLGEERYDEALAALGPALQAQPDDPETSVLRGLIAQGRGDVDAAVAALDAGVAGGASHPERLHALLGDLELLRGHSERAAQHCASAAEFDAASSGVFSTWGVALFRQKAYAEAAGKLERAVEIDPADAFSHYCLGVIYRDYLGDDPKALAHFEAHREHGGTRPNVEEWIRRLRG